MGGGLPRGVNAPGDRPEGLSPGYAFSDRLAPESVIGFVRNERSACPGIGDRHGPEHATTSSSSASATSGGSLATTSTTTAFGAATAPSPWTAGASTRARARARRCRSGRGSRRPLSSLRAARGLSRSGGSNAPTRARGRPRPGKARTQRAFAVGAPALQLRSNTSPRSLVPRPVGSRDLAFRDEQPQTAPGGHRELNGSGGGGARRIEQRTPRSTR